MRTPGQGPAPGPAPLSTAARLVGVATLLVAIAGILSQGVIYLCSSDEGALAYARGLGIKISFGVAFINLFITILHYHRTRMRLDLLTRILCYLWILATVLFLLLRKQVLMGG